MGPEEIQGVEETTEAIVNATSNTNAEKNYNSLIPGLEDLPPDTQRVVIESYEHYDSITKRIDSYTKGSEQYLEKIPDAMKIIETNIPSREQKAVEIPPKKQEYVKDTVNIVELCKIVAQGGFENLETKNQLWFYQQLETYGRKYDIKYLQGKLEKWKGDYKEVKDYYAKTPKAALKRMLDSRSERANRPEFQETSGIDTLAKYTLLDYTYRSSEASRIGRYNPLTSGIQELCQSRSLLDEEFLGKLDEKTKQINSHSKEIEEDDECQRRISKKTGHVFIEYRSNETLDPSAQAKGDLSKSVMSRLKTATRSLEEETDQIYQEIEQKKLDLSGIYELNSAFRNLSSSQAQYQNNLDRIADLLEQKERVYFRRNIAPIKSKEEIESEEKRLKEVLQSEKMLYHGTTTIESALGIATIGLASRKKQEQIQGWSIYNTIGSLAADKRRSVPNESEPVFFATGIEGAYFIFDYRFSVGIPEGIAARNYSIGYEGSYEVALLDREDPENGCLINPEDAYLYIGPKLFDRMVVDYKNKHGGDFAARVKEIWGDRVIISSELPPEKMGNLNLPPVNNARKVPTNSLWTDKGGLMQRVYKIVYS